jgi:hypothetical protein
MIAAAIIAWTTASGWAFTQQMLSPGGNGNYNFNYTDPDHPNTTSQSPRPSDSSGPVFQFNIERGETGQFGFQNGNRFDSNSGNHSFGNSSNPTDPRYYLQGNGN